MNLIQKSIKNELTRNFGGSTVILFTIVMTIMLIRILGQASKGQADPSEVILLIGLNGIGNAAPILILSLFISVVYTFSRMYLDSEMVIWFSSGISLSYFLKPLAKFSWPIIVAITLLSVGAWPWSNTQTQLLKNKFESRSDIERVAPGKFQESSSQGLVFFIEKKKQDDDLASSVFISKVEGETETITTAKAGIVEFISGEKYIALTKGQQTILNHSTGETRITEFDNFKYWINPIGKQILTGIQSQMLSTFDLIVSPDSINRGELFWRIGLILSAINLAMLAIQVSSMNPRVGRSYSLAMALLCFFGYNNMLNIGKRLIAEKTFTFGEMMLMLHGTASLIILIWYLHTEFNLSWRRFITSPTAKLNA